MASLFSRAVSSLKGRHIQDHTLDVNVTKHWGYADRQVPCLNGPGNCAYLDLVYSSHDTGMIFTGVLWLTFLAIFIGWGLFRLFTRSSSSKPPSSSSSSSSSPPTGLNKFLRAAAATSRHHLLPDCIRVIFGRTTRLQVLILALLAGYLSIFSFAGLTYGKWLTPIKPRPGEPEGLYDTRTTLGPWSNRVGVLAYALTPLSVLLASRESLLTVVTGLPYQKFMFLHRWVGYIIVVQALLHTVGWIVVVVGLYGPQPRRSLEWVHELYLIWGIVAVLLLLFLYSFTLPFVIRRTGYEFFRKAHYVLAMVYCGACIAHWERLHCFLTPAIALWFVDRFVRAGRTYLIHRQAIGKDTGFFHPAQASAILFPNSVDGDIVRLDFEHPHRAWDIGQHFYLCFTEGSIWQSHPLTPLNAPVTVDGLTRHSYLFRAKSGETLKMAELLKDKSQKGESLSTGVILTGPYGESLLPSHRCSDENILCIAGGTGITYALPTILALARRAGVKSDRRVELIWFVRHASDVEWIRPEIDALETEEVEGVVDLAIRVYATRDGGGDTLESGAASSSDEQEKGESKEKSTAGISRREILTVEPASSIKTVENARHPDVRPLVEEFLDKTIAGPTTVIASGPGAMMSELRKVIADNNSGSRVWKGQQRYDVALRCDDRLEY